MWAASVREVDIGRRRRPSKKADAGERDGIETEAERQREAGRQTGRQTGRQEEQYAITARWLAERMFAHVRCASLKTPT